MTPEQTPSAIAAIHELLDRAESPIIEIGLGNALLALAKLVDIVEAQAETIENLRSNLEMWTR